MKRVSAWVKNVRKPTAVQDYNIQMGSADPEGQMAQLHLVEQNKCPKW
jgi:hypothetical protein